MMSSSTQTKKSRGDFAPVDATHAVRWTTYGQVEGCLPEVEDDCSSTRNSARPHSLTVFQFFPSACIRSSRLLPPSTIAATTRIFAGFSIAIWLLDPIERLLTVFFEQAPGPANIARQRTI
jgi:hypothetical protein